MERRTFLKSSLLALGGVSAGCSTLQDSSTKFSVSQTGHKIEIFSDKIKEQFNIIFSADVHIAVDENLQPPFDDFAKRMHKYGARNADSIIEFSKVAKEKSSKAIFLAGDIINYPSKGNIEIVADAFKKSSVPIYYVAGNHDWHFEGVEGSDNEQRAKWLPILKPLYKTQNQLVDAVVINGVKFILLDDSTYDILPEQLSLFERLLREDNLPKIVVCHIPFYAKGRDIGFGLGNPQWGAKKDPSYKIERRQQWSEKQSPFAMQLHSMLFSDPNVMGVLAGHIHGQSADYVNGKFQFVTHFGGHKKYLEVVFLPA